MHKKALQYAIFRQKNSKIFWERGPPSFVRQPENETKPLSFPLPPRSEILAAPSHTSYGWNGSTKWWKIWN